MSSAANVAARGPLRAVTKAATSLAPSPAVASTVTAVAAAPVPMASSATPQGQTANRAANGPAQPLLVPFARQLYTVPAARSQDPPLDAAAAAMLHTPHMHRVAHHLPPAMHLLRGSGSSSAGSTATAGGSGAPWSARLVHLPPPPPMAMQIRVPTSLSRANSAPSTTATHTPPPPTSRSSPAQHAPPDHVLSEEVQKIAFKLRDDERHVLEATASLKRVRLAATGSEQNQLHVSVASQIGCKHACAYCVSSKLGGLRRNVALEEMLAQIAYFTQPEAFANASPPDVPSAQPLSPSPFRRGASVSHTPLAPHLHSVALHGHGEPLDNPDALDLLAFLHSPSYLRAFGADAAPATSISTVGITANGALETLLDDLPHTSVMWSLVTPFAKQRAALMPTVESASPLVKVAEMMHAARRRGRDAPVGIAYTLFQGVNDSPAHLAAVAKLARGEPLDGVGRRRRRGAVADALPVALIAFHPVARGSSDPAVTMSAASWRRAGKAAADFASVPPLAAFQPAPAATVQLWLRELQKRGVDASVQEYFEMPRFS